MNKTQFYRYGNDRTLFLPLPVSESPASDLFIKEPINQSEAAKDHHELLYSWEDSHTLSIQIGEPLHPMTPEHYIQWIFVRTLHGGIWQELTSKDAPEATFNVRKDELVEAFAYCNVHGLWSNADNTYEFDEMVCSPEFTAGCIDMN